MTTLAELIESTRAARIRAKLNAVLDPEVAQ